MWSSIEETAAAIRQGGVVAYPTEGVFGLGCDPANEAAVQRLLHIKQRPLSKGLILLAASTAQLQGWIDASQTEWDTLQATWPAAVTFLVTPTSQVPDWIRGDHNKVAVRVCAHPLARQLAQIAATPIVSTSANLAGQPSLKEADAVQQQLGSQLDAVLFGECNISDKPSTIIDLATQRVIRP